MLKHLQIHDRGVPVRELLRLYSCLAMAKKFNRDKVHLLRELFVGILITI